MIELIIESLESRIPNFLFGYFTAKYYIDVH